MFTIQTVLSPERITATYSSRDLYGKKIPWQGDDDQTPKRVVMKGDLKVDTRYRYSYSEGWLGDIPVSLAYMTADRTYTQTRLLFEQVGGSGRSWVA